MPSVSTKQRNYIFYLRGKYGSKSEAPEKYKWVFDKGWDTIKKESGIEKYKPLLISQSK